MQVNFLTKLVAQKPGKQVREMIKNVMLGKDEGADRTDEEDSKRRGRVSNGIAGRVSISASFLQKLMLIEFRYIVHAFNTLFLLIYRVRSQTQYDLACF